MEKAREIQLNALDTLGRHVARLDEALNELQRQKNTFDAEAKIYFFMQLAKQASARAQELHADMHRANSALGEWHDDLCLYGTNVEVRP